MSNFLDNFDDEKYKRFLEEESYLPEEKDKSKTKFDEEPSFTGEASFTEETIPAEGESNQPSKNRAAHQGGGNKRLNKKLVLGALVALIVILITVGAVYASLVKVPNFMGKQIVEVQTWGLKHGVEIEVSEEYSLDYDAGTVSFQSVQPEKKIFKSKGLHVTMSMGGDPEEHIKLPNFSKMKLQDIEKWKNQKKLENVKIIKEFSETVKKDLFLRMEFKNSDVDADNFKRKDSLMIYVSKGAEVYEKNIVVPNFVNKSKEEVESWAESNAIKVRYDEITSEQIDPGIVISQSIPEKEMVARKDEMSVEISLGKAIVVPWFGDYSMEEAGPLAGNRGLNAMIRERYNSDIPYGSLIYQSIEAGTKLSQKDDLSMDVIFSLGLPYIEDLTDKTENDLLSYFYSLNSKGAEISYTVHYQRNDNVPKGTVMSATKMNEFVPIGSYIDVYVSA